MAKLIVIRGTQSSGKTTTAGLVYKELLNFCEINHIFNNSNVKSDSLKYGENGETLDFTAVLTFGKMKIGIISEGDIPYFVRPKLLDFIKLDVVICSARSRNKTGSVYKMLLDEFKPTNPITLEIFTEFSRLESEKNSVKQVVVDRIIGEVRRLTN